MSEPGTMADKAWANARAAAIKTREQAIVAAADKAHEEACAAANAARDAAWADANKAHEEACAAANNEQGTTTEGAARDDILAHIRSGHWSVAVHNDYISNGVAYTFWLLTHPSGRWVKGEGKTDLAALTECQRQIVRHSLERPARPYGVRIQEDQFNSTLMLTFNTYAQAVKYWEWMRLQDA